MTREGRPGHGEGLLRGMAAIAVTGIALGVAFNWTGLTSRPAWGLPWIGEDRLAALESLETLAPEIEEAEPGYGYEQIDDPMAIGLGGGDEELPTIPELDRPIQIELEAVKRLFDAGAAIIIDAREPDEYAAGHITGAVNLAFDEVTSAPERMERLEAAGRALVVYCSGGTCEVSLDLAWELLAAGQTRVVVYVGGFSEWAEAGYPVTAGEVTGS